MVLDMTCSVRMVSRDASLRSGARGAYSPARAPIIPVGIAGAYDALPRTQALPQFTPLFMPSSRGGVAVAVGEKIDGNRCADMEREPMLEELRLAIQKMKDRAEKLR